MKIYSAQGCKAIYDILAKLRFNGAKCDDGLDATAEEIFALGKNVASDDALWDSLPATLKTRAKGYEVSKFDLREQLLTSTMTE